MDACKDSTNIQDTDEYRRILMQTVYYSYNCSKDHCQHKGIHNPFFADVAFLHLELMTLFFKLQILKKLVIRNFFQDIFFTQIVQFLCCMENVVVETFLFSGKRIFFGIVRRFEIFRWKIRVSILFFLRWNGFCFRGIWFRSWSFFGWLIRGCMDVSGFGNRFCRKLWIRIGRFWES